MKYMTNIDSYIHPLIIKEIREAISDAGENEVFCIGKTNDEQIVVHVEVIARGNEFAVPMVYEAAGRGDVVIHNHPSGNVNPSENDLVISHQLSNAGIASYIVNNEVSRIYAVIEPFRKDKIQKLDINKICLSLQPGGIVSRNLPNYEHRPQQVEMINQTAIAFNEAKIGVIEAGTGVGKSLAYLIPAIYWATQNHDRCVVSTRTINLQEQLIKKDIPFLKKILGVEFEAVLVKGRGNYVCLRKLARLRDNQQLLIHDEHQDEIGILLDWSKSTKDGSRSDLSFIPNSAVWEQVASESDTCLRSTCEFFQQCFVTKARRKANQANILVSNHSLLFSDLAVRSLGADNAVLPKYHHLIFDEAHNIEDIATDYFGSGVTRTGIARALRRLHYKTKKGPTGFLIFLSRKLAPLINQYQIDSLKIINEKINNELIPQCEAAISQNDELMDGISEFVTSIEKSTLFELKLRINDSLRQHPLWAQLVIRINNFARLLKKLTSGLNSIMDKLDEINLKLSRDILFTKVDIESQRIRLNTIVETINQIINEQDAENVRWLEIFKRKTMHDIVRLRIAPLNISEQMNEMVFKNFQTIILTSATLTISGSNFKNDFQYFSKQTGLNLSDTNRVLIQKIPAPFDYQKQSITAIPTDIPLPNSTEFADEISKIIFRAIEISSGRAFILFTSYGLLNKVYNFLSPKLEELGITAFKQGQINRHTLLQKFKSDKTSVLFATDSFWQGVDVEGDALESVIITKLPFKVPSEPIIEARIEAIERAGGNAFMEYSVPQAVLKLKQGFGRLIRKKTDRGSVFILDKRIIEKFYGKIFLRSLPQSKIASGPSEHVLHEVEKFFKIK